MFFNWIESLFLSDVAFYNQKVKRYLEDHDYDAAIEALNSLIALKPNIANLYRNRAYAFYRKGDFQQAAADYTKILSLGTDDAATVYLYRGSSYHLAGHESLVIDDYAAALGDGLDLDQAVATLRYRGNLLCRQGDFKRAETNFQELLRLAPQERENCLFYLGWIELEKKNFLLAVNLFTEWITLHPEDAYSLYHRAFANIKLHNWLSALHDLDEMISLQPTDAYAFNNRGLVKYQLNDKKSAVKDYQRAIEIDPTIPYPHVGLGEISFSEGDFTSAISFFERGMELNPKHLSAQAGLAVTYHALNQAEKSIQIWQEISESEPRFQQIDWIRDELNWNSQLLNEVQKIMEQS